MRRTLIAAVIALCLAACHSNLPTAPGEVGLVGSLRARAESAIGPGPADGPALLVRVIVTNRGAAPDSVKVTGCTVLVRVEVRAPSGATTVYDDGQPPCAAIVTRIALTPSAADTLYRSVDLSTLGSGARSGARLTTEARFDGLTLDAGSVVIP